MFNRRGTIVRRTIALYPNFIRKFLEAAGVRDKKKKKKKKLTRKGNATNVLLAVTRNPSVSIRQRQTRK